MRWISICLLLCVAASPLPLVAPDPPSTKPITEKTTIVNTGPVSVPFKLTDTNHILIRLKINGKGPFNFIVDTGAPLMILRVPAAEKLGLKPDKRGLAYLDQMDIEGGMMMKHVQCLVDTPYQIEGMNAIGASGVDLDGMLGYAVLARFRMQIDMSQDHMIWTPVAFNPPSQQMRRTSTREPEDPSEGNLESMGGLLKVLGPLIKPIDVPAQHRGLLGIELASGAGSVSVQSVLGDSPADKSGILPGDCVVSVNKKPVKSITDAQQAMESTLIGQVATLVLKRNGSMITMHISTGEGL